MKFLLCTIILSILYTVRAQQCQARFNRSIVGSYSLVANCQGTILHPTESSTQPCCISTTSSSTTRTCLSSNDFNNLYNTSRGQFLRTVLNYGLYAAGICDNCQAKAAFLAIVATMTNNFQTDEVTGSDTQFIADDNKYGNSQEGDGSRYRRRGLFGVRGRVMYEKLQTMLPQYQSVNNPESVALLENAIIIASMLWNNPELENVGSALTPHADGSFYGFSMLWYRLVNSTEHLAIAAQYYSTFLRQLQCGGDLYPGQGPTCRFNSTHNGTCTPDCIKGLEDSSTFCGCSGPKGPRCPNSPKHVRCCVDTCSQELKMDLGLVLDASGSIAPSDYQLQLQFTRDLLDRVNVGPNRTHVAIINYSDNPQTLTRLNRDYTLEEKLRRVNDAVHYASGTDTASALQRADFLFSYAQGRRSSSEGATPVIFVITDGASNDRNATIRAADVLKQQEITLVSVGVGKGPNLTELHAICTPPASENYFAISDYTALEQKINQFTSRSCSEPAPVPSNTTVTGEVGKDKYKFLKVTITTVGNKILITVTLFNGQVKLFYSFTNRNPKDPADFIDYEAETDESKKSFFPRSSAKSSEVKLMIDKPNDEVEFAYIGIKGVDEENNFEVNFDDCAEVECPRSTATMMKLNFFLTILLCLFIF